ncbi:1-acyl-sn-glycerol-3-phosphate acyltransferase [Flavobacteriaceae bacterium F08102]|nr:1-acyl-sn-glycerol-3-phosphate acyltransferase [Flavobacteriaceae bacterium F08102]
MAKAFYRLYHFYQRSKWTFYTFLTLYILVLGFLASRLSFEEDITKLIPTSKEAALTNEVLQQLNFADKVVVLVSVDENGSLQEAVQYANAFVDSITPLAPMYIKEVQGQVDDSEIQKTLDFVYQNLPLFLNEEDYQKIEEKLTIDSLQTILLNNYKTLISPTGFAARATLLRDPLGLTFLGLEPLKALRLGDDFSVENGFVTTRDEKHLLLFISPQMQANESKKNDAFVKKLYEIQSGLNAEFKSKVSSSYYGTTVIAVANARQIKSDIQLTVTIAMSILLLILLFFYRTFWIPILLFIPPVLGALLGVASLYVLKGQVSAISIGIGAVLLGITLDYSLHILTHFRNNANIKDLYRDVTKPILMSSLTTAVAFLCLLFLESDALKDLGIFAAISVVGASIMALICIPMWLKETSKKSSGHLFDRIARYRLHQNTWVVRSLILLVIGSFFWIKHVKFDKDLSKLNFQTEALTQTGIQLDSLMNHSAKSLYVVSHGTELEEVLRQHEKLAVFLKGLQTQGDIVGVTTISPIVQSRATQVEKIKRWQEFWKAKKGLLKEVLIAEGEQIGFKASGFNQFYAYLDQSFAPLSLQEYSALKVVQLEEFIQTGSTGLHTVSSLVKVNPEKLPEVKALIAQNSGALVIDRQDVNETFLGKLKDNFNRLIGYSLIAVVLILWFFYKRFVLVVITLLPIAITWSLTLGLMGGVSIDFNIFNVIISTFIFGLGVDYSIFITNGLRKEYTDGEGELPTYKTSIILSCVTTILALGVLIFAKHPALKSISWVSIIGVVSALIVSFVLQPLIFKFFISGRTKQGLAPLQVRTFIHSIFLSTFYALGGMILSLVSVTLLPLLPISKKKKMGWLHRTMSRLVTATLYGNPFVKKQVFNPYKETFESPSIIIANHSSALDTLTIGMVTHKVIYLVNDWVYKSPIFGLLARVAGFYPVSSGIDGSLDHLKEKVRQGYSLVVFPEGRRSKTNKIGRFHKGAFFLSQALELDILPLYLHGNAEVMPKGDMIIHDGHLQVHVGKRITYDDKAYGEEVRERTKRISQAFKDQFNALRNVQEGVDYYKDILLSNYRYKEGLFEEVKKDFELNKQGYKAIQDRVPLRGEVIVVGESIGQLPVLLLAKSQDRKVQYLNPDPQKRKIAANCYTNVQRGLKVVERIDVLNLDKAKIMIVENQEWPVQILKEYVDLRIAEVILFNSDQKRFFIEVGYVEKGVCNGVTYLVIK